MRLAICEAALGALASTKAERYGLQHLAAELVLHQGHHRQGAWVRRQRERDTLSGVPVGVEARRVDAPLPHDVAVGCPGARQAGKSSPCTRTCGV